MSAFHYCVQATFAEERVANEWLAWLRDGHIADVMRGGAIDAEIVKIDGETLTYEVHYHFASRAAFATYERDFAPALRAEGLAKFPTSRGVSYRRGTGDVVWGARE